MKKIIILILFVLLFSGYSFAQEQKLEVDYPLVGESQPTFLLTNYIKYIFNFVVFIAGFLAFASLLISGIRYLVSSGNPAAMSLAKDHVLSAFWGVLIILSSYILLKTINPQLVSISNIAPENIGLKMPIPKEFISTPYPNIWWRINEIATNSKGKANSVGSLAEELKSKSDECDCKNTISLCTCRLYYLGCEPNGCYIGKNSNPCPSKQEMKIKQQNIVAVGEEMLYYKNRAIEERKDLLLEIDDLKNIIIPKKQKDIEKIEKELAEFKEDSSAKQSKQGELKRLQKQMSLLEQETDLKEQLAKSLEELIKATEKNDNITKQTKDIADKIEACFEQGVKQKCLGNCKVQDNYISAPNDPPIVGCHNSTGCLPEQCTGGNPCPVEIGRIKDKIVEEKNNISQISDKIIDIINKIIALKTK